MGHGPTTNCLEFEASAWNAELDMDSQASASTNLLNESSSIDLLDDGTIDDDDKNADLLVIPWYSDPTYCSCNSTSSFGI